MASAAPSAAAPGPAAASASASAAAAPLSERAAFQSKRRLELEAELCAARERLAALEAAGDPAQQHQRFVVAEFERLLRPEELRKIGRRVKIHFRNMGPVPVQLVRLHPVSGAPQRVCRLEPLERAGVACLFGDQFSASLMNTRSSYPVTINGAALWDSATYPPNLLAEETAEEPEPGVMRMEGIIVHHDREVPAPEDCYDKH